MELKVLREEDLEDKICVVVGTRPGIIMFSPIIRELEHRKVNFFVIHTGQHFSYNMDRQFFEDLKLKEPQYKLDTIQYCKLHGEQTAEMLKSCEQILLREKPRLVLVGGDANTNLAGALAARKLRIGVGHIEAGERSEDWRMPEEHNRRIIDHVSDILFATGKKGKENLLRESVNGKIYVTGNTIVDASIQHLGIAREKSDVLKRFQLIPNEYGLLTTHREENVDFPDLLKGTLEGVSKASQQINTPVVFLMHPRTKKRLHEFGLMEWAQSLQGIRLNDAVGYLDFLNLVAHSKIIFTDSGGVQQEACIHHIPAVTLRENTEWVETLSYGANRLAGTDVQRIVSAAQEAVRADRVWPIPFGDGTAARSIVKICKQVLAKGA